MASKRRKLKSDCGPFSADVAGGAALSAVAPRNAKGEQERSDMQRCRHRDQLTKRWLQPIAAENARSAYGQPQLPFPSQPPDGFDEEGS